MASLRHFEGPRPLRSPSPPATIIRSRLPPDLDRHGSTRYQHGHRASHRTALQGNSTMRSCSAAPEPGGAWIQGGIRYCIRILLFCKYCTYKYCKYCSFLRKKLQYLQYLYPQYRLSESIRKYPGIHAPPGSRVHDENFEIRPPRALLAALYLALAHIPHDP